MLFFCLFHKIAITANDQLGIYPLHSRYQCFKTTSFIYSALVEDEFFFSLFLQ